jgi:cytochrome b subunit of formate dehydrogenase
MYRTITITAFVILFVILGLICLVRPCSKDCLKHPLRKFVHLVTLIFIEQKLSLAGVLRKLVYLLALLCFVVLAVTGFYPTLVLNEHISGWLLMIHATFAPIMAICLAVLAVMWAGKCRFAQNDWPWFERLVQRVTLVKNLNQQAGHDGCVWQKIFFWVIIFLALPLILSVVLSMFHIFGTDWQNLLIAIHRYCATVFGLAVVAHTYMLIRDELKD